MKSVQTQSGFSLQRVQVIRRLWRLGFYVVSCGSLAWIFINIASGRYNDDPSHFIPLTIFLFVFCLCVYSFAFQLKDLSFANFNFLLVVFGILFVICEVGIRVWDYYDPIFRPAHLKNHWPIGRGSFSPYRPESTGLTHGHVVRINSLGFRGQEYPIIKPTQVFRVIVLGDSFTFGEGVAEDEIYTTLLQKQLRAKYPKQSIEVINLGVAGASAVDEMRLLEKIGPLLEPDLVLIGFVGNDVRESDQVPEQERNRWAFPFLERGKSVLISRFKFFEWLTMKYDQLLMNIGIRPNYFASIEAAYAGDSSEWKRLVEAYQRMLEWTETRNIPPPLVGLFITTPYYDPQKNDFIKMTPLMQIQDRHIKQVELALNALGIPTVDPEL